MNNHISCKKIRERLEEQGLNYGIYTLTGGYFILVMEKSGRIFGPYKEDQEEGIFWANKAFGSREAFASFLTDPHAWCFGGDRIWVTPEFPFFCRQRKDFFQSYVVQKGIDPADYTMRMDSYGTLFCAPGSRESCLSQNMRRKSFTWRKPYGKMLILCGIWKALTII